jgi:hypothetical protein
LHAVGFIVALWHVEGPTMGAYIAKTGVATYAPAKEKWEKAHPKE